MPKYIKMNDIAIYGAGGYGKEIACLIMNKNKNEKKYVKIA